MIKKDKQSIMRRLQEQYDYVITNRYKQEQVLGIFAYGSMNYGYASPTSDVDSKIILLPTFEDIYLNRQCESKQLIYENEYIDVKDIRLMREMWMKQNINFMEILYTNYFILNDKYKELFNRYFISNREAIAHYDKAKTIKSIGKQIISMLHQKPTDNKTLYNAKRLYNFLVNYVNEKSYEECLTTVDEKLWKIKYGDSILCDNAELALQYATELEQLVKELMAENADVASPRRHEAEAALDTGVKEVMKLALSDVLNPLSASKTKFFNNLTTMETKAYYTIVSIIHEAGDVIISDLVTKTSISRPVYNNLLNKMKQYNVAKVFNKGVSGTHIEIIQPEMREEAKEML